MATKGSGLAEQWLEIDRWSGGVGWIAYPGESMQRAGHAVAVDGDVWVIDPVDTPDLDDLLAEFGEVRGVVVLLDRHERDAAVVADRHDVPVFLPARMEDVQAELRAPVARFRESLPETDFRTIAILNNRFWREFALYDRANGTLVVPESLGTAAYYGVGEGELGVHPALRLWPPRKPLGGLTPDRILVGHGEGVFEDATAALDEALATARRTAPKLYAKSALRTFRS